MNKLKSSQKHTHSNTAELTPSLRNLHLVLAVLGLILGLSSILLFANSIIQPALYYLGIGLGGFAMALGESVYLARGYKYKYLFLFILVGTLLFITLLYYLTIFALLLFN